MLDFTKEREKLARQLEENQKPIVVVGTGRSGTSIIAGMLFYLGVWMGNWFYMPTKTIPHHNFEDAEIDRVDNDYLSKKISREEWKKRLNELFDKRRSYKTQWGWKTLTIASTLDDLKEIIDARYIYCTRDEDESIDSFCKIKIWPRNYIEKWVKERERHIRKHLPKDALIIKFKDIKPETVDILIQWANLHPVEQQIAKAKASVLFDDQKERIINANAVPR